MLQFTEMITARWVLNHPEKMNKDHFCKLCNLLKDFPLQDKYLKPIGLYLEGYHFFKRIEFDEIEKVPQEEIMQITKISPLQITSLSITPWDYNEGILSGRIITRRHETNEYYAADDIIGHLEKINQHLTERIKDNRQTRYDIIFYGGTGLEVLKTIIHTIIPELPAGDYSYEYSFSFPSMNDGKREGKGNISPVPGFTALLKEIEGHINTLNEEIAEGLPDRYSIKINNPDNSFSLEKVTKDNLQILLSGNNIPWLKAVMQLIDGLLENNDIVGDEDMARLGQPSSGSNKN